MSKKEPLMKIVKASDVNEQGVQIDSVKVTELTAKFDEVQKEIIDKKYDVTLSKETSDYLMQVFYEQVSWKGYESYAISETFEKLFAELIEFDEVEDTDEAVVEYKISLNAEIIEAVFHFLKNFIGTGVKYAKLFKDTCDSFAIGVQAINDDRVILRDLSLELTAAEQGIEVETLVKAYEADANAQEK